MPRAKHDRGDAFMFYPADYLDDPVVRRMGVMGRGIYGGALLPALWRQPEPGVVKDDDELIASLAMCTLRQFRKFRDRVREAFDTETRPGFWVQKRMVAEYAAQCAWYQAKSAMGSHAARARWGNAPHAAGMRTASAPYAGSGSGSGSGESKRTPLPPNDPPATPATSESFATRNTTNGKGPDKENPNQDADEFFAKHFWPTYPRRKNRAAALRAWQRVVGVGEEGETRANAICGALERLVATDWRDREEQFVPYAHRWLRNRGWEE